MLYSQIKSASFFLKGSKSMEHISSASNQRIRRVLELSSRARERRREKAFVIECDYILKMGLGFCICKLGKIVKVIIADIIEEGFFEFSFVADNVKPILRTDKAVNGDDPIFPEAFQVYYDNKTETIDMNTILTNSKRYGYNRYS